MDNEKIGIRIGRLEARIDSLVTRVKKFNPYHDPRTGRFTSAGGGASRGTGTKGGSKLTEEELHRRKAERIQRRIRQALAAERGQTAAHRARRKAAERAAEQWKKTRARLRAQGL